MHDREPVALKLLGLGAVRAELLALVHERRMQLVECLKLPPPHRLRARGDLRPQ